jgi:hypothetical protein
MATKKKKAKRKTKGKKPPSPIDLAEVREWLKIDKPEKAFSRLLHSIDHDFMIRYLFQYLCASKFSTYKRSLQTFGLTINDYLATKNKKRVEVFQAKLMRMDTVETHYRTLHNIQASILTYILSGNYMAAHDALQNIIVTELGLLTVHDSITVTSEAYNNRLIAIVVDLSAAKWENGKTLKVLYGK